MRSAGARSFVDCRSIDISLRWSENNSGARRLYLSPFYRHCAPLERGHYVDCRSIDISLRWSENNSGARRLYLSPFYRHCAPLERRHFANCRSIDISLLWSENRLDLSPSIVIPQHIKKIVPKKRWS